MKRAFPKLLAHLGFILTLVLTTLLVVDRINPSMDFIDNDITKGMFLVFCLITAVNSLILIAAYRRR